MIFKKLKNKIYKYKDELILFLVILLTAGLFKYIKYELNNPKAINQSVIKESFYLEKYSLKKHKGHDLDGLFGLVDEKIAEKEELKRKIKEAEGRKIQREFKKQKEKERVAVSRSGGKSSSNKSYYYEVTAYTAGFESTGKRKGDKNYGKTASGAYVKEGRTIACPPEIPFGTKIKIDTVGVRVCEDRGGAIKGRAIDLYMNDLNSAKKFGRQTLKVTILN